MTKLRDSQRSKLYSAEAEAFQGAVDRLVTFDLTVGFVEKVWRDAYVRSTFPMATRYPAPRVDDGRGTRIARGSISRINLPLWARSKHVALHEIAHALRVTGAREAAHGREFAARFIVLVQHFMGRSYADALKAAFKKHRVRYKPKRTLSPETIARLRERGALLAAKRRDPENGITKDAQEMLDYLRTLEAK